MLTFKDRSLTKVGVIGSGSIGPDIALYLAKVLAVESVSVVVVDVSQAALTRGEERLRKKVEKGIASGAFSTDLGEAMLRAVTFTPEYRELRGAGMVIEAATENLEIKQKIFLKVQEICGDECIMLSNSSHLTPEEIFDGHKGVRNRNSAVLH